MGRAALILDCAQRVGEGAGDSCSTLEACGLRVCFYFLARSHMLSFFVEHIYQLSVQSVAASADFFGTGKAIASLLCAAMKGLPIETAV